MLWKREEYLCRPKEKEEIAKTRFNSKGLGEFKLVNNGRKGVECTEEKCKVNRRSEFRIIEGPEEFFIE